MFKIAIKNMLKDKIVTLSLIIGFLLSIAIVSSIPMYTGGILNKLLHESLINYGSNNDSKAQTDASETKTKADIKSDEDVYAAMISEQDRVSIVNVDYATFLDTYKENKSYFYKLADRVKIPVYAKKDILTLNYIYFEYKDIDGQAQHANSSIVSVSDFAKHIKLIKGHMPKSGIYGDKTADVIVDSTTFKNFNMEIGKTYGIICYGDDNPIKVKLTGIYEINNKDNFWADKDTDFYCKLMTTENTFFNILESNDCYVRNLGYVGHKVIYDYNGINYRNADNIYENLNSIVEICKNRSDLTVDCPLISSLSDFIQNKELYTTLIWIFTMPILIIILFYVYMVSGFITDSDKEEIAVLKSRGVSLPEILRIYAYEGLIICGIGILIGPILGFFICKALSCTTGFLEFDFGLKSAKFNLSADAYLYSFAAAAIMLITLMLSVYSASKNTIVEFKRSKNKYLMSVLNAKNIDFILLAVSMYGYYEYSKYKNVSVFSGNNQVPIDPVLYIISIIFIMGFGMLILRIYRYIVKVLYTINKKFTSTKYYIAVINVLRYHLNKSMILLFVIMTISIGIFDVKVAKNINLSSENTIRYSVGADLTMQQYWKKTVDKTYSNYSEKDSDRLYVYTEPYCSQLSKVKGIQGYTKVLNVKSIGQVDKGRKNSLVKCSVMGIIPYEFGKIAWFDRSLLKYHWYYYLNAMTKNTNCVLISSTLSKNADLNKGDTIFYRIGSGLYASGVIMDVVDYWPGCEDMKNKNQIIGNFDYIFSKIPKYPYELWIKKDPKVSNQVIYDSINAQKLKIVSYRDSSIEIDKVRKDIFFKGTNGILSLGLISVIVVTIISFMLYWIKSLKNRKLSFGVYRSLGISKKEIYIILAAEQALTLGVSIIFGIADGNMTCKLFLPIIISLWHNGKFTVPLNSISYIKEYLSLGILLLAIFIFSLFILIRYISKLKINEAVKLGDE